MTSIRFNGRNILDELVFPALKEMDTNKFERDVNNVVSAFSNRNFYTTRYDDTHFHIFLEMPGCSKEDIDIVLEKGSLSVKCEKRAIGGEEVKYDFSFVRRIVDEKVDTSNPEASLKDGILHLKFKLHDEDKHKVKINIS